MAAILTEDNWRSAFDNKGILHIDKVIRDIETGGIQTKIRGEVWEFLLGSYDRLSTFSERDLLRQNRRAQYSKLKADCLSTHQCIGTQENLLSSSEYVDVLADFRLSCEVEKYKWLKCLKQITMDVRRTDQTLEFYNDPQNLARLRDILAVYAWMDPECGYCQGMNELCSYMCYVFDDEADAFWCFYRLMQKVRLSFMCSTYESRYEDDDIIRTHGVPVVLGLRHQFEGVYWLMKHMNPHLHEKLMVLNYGDYSFLMVEMLLLLFRREFSFNDGLGFWDMMWATEYLMERPDYFLGCEGDEDWILISLMGSKAFTENDEGEWVVLNNSNERSKRPALMYVEPLEDDDEAPLNMDVNFDATLPLGIYMTAALIGNIMYKVDSEFSDICEVYEAVKKQRGNLDGQEIITSALCLRKRYHKELESINGNKKRRVWCFNLPPLVIAKRVILSLLYCLNTKVKKMKRKLE